MKKKEMDETITEELAHIPRGDIDQNELRMIYKILRQNELSKETPCSKEDTLRRAIEKVKENEPNFIPKYDSGFFKLNR